MSYRKQIVEQMCDIANDKETMDKVKLTVKSYTGGIVTYAYINVALLTAIVLLLLYIAIFKK